MERKVVFEKESSREEFTRRIKEMAAELDEFFKQNEDMLKQCGVVFLAALDNGESFEGQTFIMGAPKIIAATITESCRKFPMFASVAECGLKVAHNIN